MKHYFNPMSRAVTTDWMLKELDVQHEQILINFTSDENKLPEFREINPMGKLPTLVDGDVVVTEVAAICAYLADKFPEKKLAPEIGSVDRATYYRYLFLAGNTIEPALSLAASGVTHPEPRSAGWGDVPRVLATVEAMTPETGWALGEQFTTADVVFGGLLDFSISFNLIDASPKVAAYVARIRQRPCYRETHSVFAEIVGDE
ncbi:glutathione S-transferase family protein [Microbulbifer sp. OS29]|uniref:Glutathione S-transferase family protein n=1 Tax=Microbulbifer okhotskensis TaxID=2926617 RepID=A0A9X2EXJ2_9GAMM|nr:glutathione S-transferase family protein [Microbulbifer okhotskensis]MCO1337053.1 glutathione S-transferase family protein [Microbulbifer okhotskensis]